MGKKRSGTGGGAKRPKKQSATGHSSLDAVLDVYKKDVDMTLIRENLKLSPAQRFEKFIRFMRLAAELRRSGERHRSGK